MIDLALLKTREVPRGTPRSVADVPAGRPITRAVRRVPRVWSLPAQLAGLLLCSLAVAAGSPAVRFESRADRPF